MQGTLVQSLVREDPTCLIATKPTLQLLIPCAANTEALEPRAVLQNKKSHSNEKPMHTTKRVAAARGN